MRSPSSLNTIFSNFRFLLALAIVVTVVIVFIDTKEGSPPGRTDGDTGRTGGPTSYSHGIDAHAGTARAVRISVVDAIVYTTGGATLVILSFNALIRMAT